MNEGPKNSVHWNDRNDGFNLDNYTHWHFEPANPSNPKSQDILKIYLTAPEMIRGSESQAVAVYEGDVAQRLRDYLAWSGVELP